MRKFVFIALALISASVNALDEFVITLENHLFKPAVIEIPANTKVKLRFINLDSTPEEIDSFDMNREKVVFGNSKATIFVGPLEPGNYEFFGEFHPQTAVGTVKVIPKEVFLNAN